MDRRRFLRTSLGGAAGAAGAVALTGCGAKEREIHKVISQLEPSPAAQLSPDHSVWYATACTACDAGCGLHVRVVDGRAKKVEGAPDHPVSRGGVCAQGQALVQALYHPDRSGGASLGGAAVNWDAALAELTKRLTAAAAKGPGRVALVGPRFPGARAAVADESCGRCQGHPPLVEQALWTPLAPDPPSDGAIASLGAIVSLGAPLLESGRSPVGWAKALARMRARPGRRGLFVHVGPRMGSTGAAADHWISARAGTERAVGLALSGAKPAGDLAEWAMRLKAAGRVLMVGGGTPWVGRSPGLQHLAGHLERGGVDVLLTIGPTRLKGAGFHVALVERDAEAPGADLILRTHTGLEDWGSAPGRGGVTLQQPVVSPRWDTRGVGDLLLATMGGGTMRDFVARHHKVALAAAGTSFEQALGAGGAYFPLATATWPEAPSTGATQGPGLTLLGYAAPATGDGRLAHTPWLREAREPVSGGLGDTWAELSPTAAAAHGVRDGGRVRLKTASGSLVRKARVHPGQRDDVVSVPLGQDPGGATDPVGLFPAEGPATVTVEAVA